MTATPALSRDDLVRLGDEIADTAAHIDAAIHRLLGQIRAFDLAEGWGAMGALSCAHWLSWRIGMSLGVAREKVRVAHALAGLPLIDEALRHGEVSYSKIRAMTRVATPANEELLLTMARTTTAAQLEKLTRLYRPVQAGNLDPRDIEEGIRFVSSRPTDRGTVRIQIDVLPDEAARIIAAIDAHAERGNRADGAVAMAEVALRSDAGDHVRPPVEAVVHIAAETLGGVTDVGDGIAAETSRRLLCDCGVVPILEDANGTAIDVGRKTRTIPVALRRALEARDGGCRFPGCGNHRFVDAHHVVHWIDGGKTCLSNTLLLCRRHHRALHEYAFSVAMTGREVVFREASGEAIPAVAARPRLQEEGFVRLDAVLGSGGIVVNAETNQPGWDGLPVNYAMCVGALGSLDGLG